MKKSICLAAVMAMLMLLASCKAVSDTSAEASVSAAPAAQENSVSGQSDVPEQTEDEFVTVTDDLDREVTVQMSQPLTTPGPPLTWNWERML